ncbi:MAG: AAA family ATPase, partial [Bacteroidia bacterium]
MHIEHLELKNFAGFEDFSMDFPTQNVCVFIGENGSGKTSILEAIYCLIVRSKINDKSFFLFREQIVPQKRNVSSGENTNLLSFLELNWGEDLLYLQFMSKELEWKEFKTKIKNASNQKNLFTTIDLSIANSDFIKNLTEDSFIYGFEKFSIWYKELSLYDIYITKKRKTDYSPKQAVDEAIKRFSGIIIDTEIGESINDLQVVFWKEGKKLSLHHLSQGEQKTINLIGQIIDAFVP